ncbi:MAG: YXWGXW repeat-containing protein [Myxococcales bacterium]|nr:YXWGXW repeat-containing protein [Myxococcales bacterium]
MGSARAVVTGTAPAVGPGGGAVAGMAAAVALAPDARDSTYRVDFDVWLPQATEIDWTIQCGATVAQGVVGEDFEAYRARRLAELRAERERAQRTAAAIGGVVGQAVVGQVAATSTVSTPTADAQATVAVDGAALGAAAGAATVSTDVALAPGDLGAGNRHGRATLLVAEANAGACTMALAPRAPLAGDLVGTFAVARLDDSARWEAVRARDQAIVVRSDLRARLIARGGDVEARARAAEVAAQARYQAQARGQAQAEVAAQARSQAQAEAARQVALELERARAIRGELVASLELRGGDRTLRYRLAAEASAHASWVAGQCHGTRRDVRDQLVARGGDLTLRDRQRALELELRVRADADLAAARAAADLAWARQQAEAEAARAQVIAQLTARGAAVRTPMPAPVDEFYGEPPMPGYAWSSGHWEWRTGAWQWTPGYWLGSGAGATVTTVVAAPPPPPSGAAAVAGAVAGAVVGGVTISVGASATVAAPPPAPPRPRVQDHR